MRKLELDDIILEKDVYNNIGREIIKRWNTGEGSWLDSLYSTQLKNPMRVGESIYEYLKDRVKEIESYEDIAKNKEAIDFVKSIAEIDHCFDNGTYIYSFATKFCNRLNKNFPIFDRYVAGLIYRYLNFDNSDEKIKLLSLGDYEKYTKAYDRLLKKYNIEISENNTYKEIDICMWTCAKIHKLAWDDDVGKDIDYIQKSMEQWSDPIEEMLQKNYIDIKGLLIIEKRKKALTNVLF